MPDSSDVFQPQPSSATSSVKGSRKLTMQFLLENADVEDGQCIAATLAAAVGGAAERVDVSVRRAISQVGDPPLTSEEADAYLADARGVEGRTVSDE